MAGPREASDAEAVTRAEPDSGSPVTDEDPSASRGRDSTWLKDQVLIKSSDARLGRYVLLRILGEGGMGVVFAGYDEELDRKVAIKLLRVPEGGPAFDRDLLLHEARALAQVSHPNIVGVYDVGEIDGHLFIAMEFVVGEPLSEWLRATSRPWRDVVEVFAQAGRGLQAAHEAGLVHCDFKPANVLVGKDGRVRVLDFGLARLREGGAKAAGEDDMQARDRGGRSRPTAGGTPAYMAPETYLGGICDARSDQFAFAVALHEGLYGRRPFRGDTLADLRLEILVGAPNTPTDSRTPAFLRRAIHRALDKDPAARWPSVQALLAEIGRDPVRTRRRVLVAAALIGGLTAAGVGMIELREARIADALAACQAPEPAVAATIDARRPAIRAAIVATDLPYASQSAEVVDAALLRFAGRWAEVHAAACVGAIVERTIPAEMMDLRERCAARQRQQVEATLEVLASADATVVEHIDTVVGGLPRPETCEELRALVEFEEGGDVDPRRDAVRVRLDRAMAEIQAGRVASAEAQIEPLLAEAPTLRDRPLRAEIYDLAAECAIERGEYERGDALRVDGLADALASDRVVKAASIALDMVYDELFRRGRLAEARRWERIAAGLVERADRPVLRYTLTAYRAALASHVGDQAASLALYDQALELATAANVSDVSRAGLDNNRGIALNALGRHAEAIAAYESAILRVHVKYGDDHPSIQQSRGNIALAHFSAGDLTAAAGLYREVAAAQQRLYGAHPDVAVNLQNLATVELEAGDLDAAFADASRARAMLAEVLPDDRFLSAYVSVTFGDIARRRGRLDEGEAECAAGLQALEALLGADHLHLTAPLRCLGEVALDRGRPADARPLLERALALMGARDELSRADRAHLRAALARAVAGTGEVDRARDLADQALADYAAIGPAYAGYRDALAQWRRTL